MKYSQIFIGIVICILLEFVVYNLNHKYNFWQPVFATKQISDSEKHEGGGLLTNPLLECMGVGEEDTVSSLNLSKADIENYVNSIIKSGQVNFMSVYVRDLNNGPWIGINEKQEFIGGSLLKVPILMSYMKMAEDDPTILKKEIKYDKQLVTNDQYYISDHKLELGKKYTVEELITFMIDYSDNNAATMLAEDLTLGELDDSFESLGLGQPDINKPYPVNTRNYAGFFRVLFNASYLNKKYSEKALQILTQVEFDKGLTKLIPKYITVAHKFGIRTEGDINQLHDCGIVYYPGHPYLICIMSKGGTFDNLADAIARVSGFVYQQVVRVK